MKIAIVSDIHDNLVNLEKCLNLCKIENIKTLICCGDITNIETIKFLSKNYKEQIYLVRGNIEIYDENELSKYDNIKYFGKIGILKIDNKNIGICHEPYLIDKLLDNKKIDIIFYGHTHKPWSSYTKASDGKEVLTVNPGTLAGTFSKASFATWDTRTNAMDLKILELL